MSATNGLIATDAPGVMLAPSKSEPSSYHVLQGMQSFANPRPEGATTE